MKRRRTTTELLAVLRVMHEARETWVTAGDIEKRAAGRAADWRGSSITARIRELRARLGFEVVPRARRDRARPQADGGSMYVYTLRPGGMTLEQLEGLVTNKTNNTTTTETRRHGDARRTARPEGRLPPSDTPGDLCRSPCLRASSEAGGGRLTPAEQIAESIRPWAEEKLAAGDEEAVRRAGLDPERYRTADDIHHGDTEDTENDEIPGSMPSSVSSVSPAERSEAGGDL